LITAADVEPFSIARALARQAVPYMDAHFSRLIPVPVKGIGSRFSCDRAYRVYFDPERARTITPATLAADIVHEVVVHLAAGHFDRSEGLDAALANVAGDEAGNQSVFALAAAHPSMLTPMGVKFDRADNPAAIRQSGWVHPLTYSHPPGLSMEEYYLMHKQDQAEKQSQQKQQGQPSGDPEPSDDEGSGDDAGTDSGTDSDEAEGSGSAPPPPQPGKPGTGRCGGCAGHSGDDDLQAKAEEQHGALPEGPNEVERAGLREEAAQAVLAHEAAHGRGSVPAGIRRMAEGLLKPAKVDWRKALRAAVKGMVGRAAGMADYTYTKRSRLQSAVRTVVLPGLAAPMVDVAVVADTSGSMGREDLLRVGSETRALLRGGMARKVWWIPTDAEAAPAKALRSIQQAMDSLVGGGGTDMGAGLRAAADVRPRVALTIVITDGDTDWPTRPPACGKVLVVLTRKSSNSTPAWAQVVHAY
jgi:predicted metal-dependent peptidase